MKGNREIIDKYCDFNYMKRNILITGGSRGIGCETVRLFTERGDKVAFIYRNDEISALKCAESTGATPIKADASDPNQVALACQKALDTLGEIHILINNAGISEIGLFDTLTDERWREIIDTNLSSAVYFSREISRHMIEKKRGSIVNIGSVWGNYGASCEVAYSASKAGLRGLTKALARELGPSGIRVNCVEPGVINTDMNAHFDEEALKELADSSALCRLGSPREVAEAIYFLSSDSASFITAQILGVDGGFPF